MTTRNSSFSASRLPSLHRRRRRVISRVAMRVQPGILVAQKSAAGKQAEEGAPRSARLRSGPSGCVRLSPLFAHPNAEAPCSQDDGRPEAESGRTSRFLGLKPI